MLNGGLPTNPGTAQAAESQQSSFRFSPVVQDREPFEYLGKPWLTTKGHKQWPIESWGTMGSRAAARWPATPYYVADGPLARWDLALRRGDIEANFRDTLEHVWVPLVEKLGREQNYPEAFFSSWGFCYAWAAASATMPDVLPGIVRVNGVPLTTYHRRALLALVFTDVLETPVDSAVFESNQPVIMESPTNFYKPLHARRRDGRQFSLGNLDQVAWLSDEVDLSQVISTHTPTNPDWVGVNINPAENPNGGWKLFPANYKKLVLRAAYEGYDLQFSTPDLR